MTREMRHMVEGEHFLKISAPQILQFGIDSALKTFTQTMTDWVEEFMN